MCTYLVISWTELIPFLIRFRLQAGQLEVDDDDDDVDDGNNYFISDDSLLGQALISFGARILCTQTSKLRDILLQHERTVNSIHASKLNLA